MQIKLFNIPVSDTGIYMLELFEQQTQPIEPVAAVTTPQEILF